MNKFNIIEKKEKTNIGFQRKKFDRHKSPWSLNKESNQLERDDEAISKIGRKYVEKIAKKITSGKKEIKAHKLSDEDKKKFDRFINDCKDLFEEYVDKDNPEDLEAAVDESYYLSTWLEDKAKECREDKEENSNKDED